MAEYIEHTCGECIHAEICEHMPTLTGWDALNPSYCAAFKNAADVVERKRGRWEMGMKCSVCGQVDWTAPNFCPNCGADMRGDGNG